MPSDLQLARRVPAARSSTAREHVRGLERILEAGSVYFFSSGFLVSLLILICFFDGVFVCVCTCIRILQSMRIN